MMCVSQVPQPDFHNSDNDAEALDGVTKLAEAAHSMHSPLPPDDTTVEAFAVRPTCMCSSRVLEIRRLNCLSCGRIL